MNKIICIISALLLSFNLFAQIPQEPSQRPLNVVLHVADSNYKISNFYGAHQAYKKALNMTKNPEASVAFKCAESCRMYQNYVEAENYYKLTLSLDSVSYPMAGFWYAEMLKLQGKYPQAAKAYDDFVTHHSKASAYHTRRAKHEYKVCSKTVYDVQDLEDINLVRIREQSINSPYSEYSPYQFKDSSLYFSGIRPLDRKAENKGFDFRNYYTKIYKSSYKDTSWQKAEEVSGVNADNTHTGNLVFGHNNEEVFFSRCELKEKYYCDIFRADYKKGKIINATQLPAPINMKNYNTTNPRIVYTHEGQYMFFSSDRPGGSGMKDIWYARRNEDGTFQKPLNCGRNVNTFGDEVTPFYDHRDSTLFFSSEMHNSLGGYDVFEAKGDIGKNSWQKPVNVGRPINSSYNDMYYHYASDSVTSFLVSNRTESMRLVDHAHGNDIYYYKLVRRSIERIKELVPLVLYFDNDQPNPGTLDSITDVTYETLLLDFMNRRDEYIKENTKGEAAERKPYYEAIVNEFFDKSLEAGWLKLFLFAELMEVILEDGYDIIITFKGYSSPLGNPFYNEVLSKRRISCVQNFFDNFQGGVFNQYVGNEPNTGMGSLKYFQVPIGETVPDNVFVKDGQMELDDFKNRRNLKNQYIVLVLLCKEKLKY
jgi:tetratricopeptide (TPR) repeat protein